MRLIMNFLKYFDRLGVPLDERNQLANVAVDAVLDSVSVAATHRKTLKKDAKCPMPISTYFWINALETKQFEMTLIVTDEESFVEYVEGCTTPSYNINQLLAAVVELYCTKGAEPVQSMAENAKNSSQCDLMLPGDITTANIYPYNKVKDPSALVGHEARTSCSKVSEDQLFYEKAMAAMISGFCRDVFNDLPDEFGAEVNQLISLKLEEG
ncbi:hypothetical protein PTKIN_Ptkin01aG0134600 [Pterospermum kingtungense]